MSELSHSIIEKMKSLQLEKEKLVDVKSKLSRRSITPKEEKLCLLELTKCSYRWEESKSEKECVKIESLTVGSLLKFIQSQRNQMT